MCNHIKTIGRVKSGQLTICTNCNHYHLTFNNIFFEFSKDELIQFKKYLFQLNTEYWNEFYPCPELKRNIPIPTLQNNLILLFNQQEIDELKKLLSGYGLQKYKCLKVDEIDYTLFLN